MAYNKGNTAGKNAAPGTNDNNFTKANGFVNVFISNADGKGKKKLGAIALYNHKENEAKLMAWLQVTGKDEAETLALRAKRLAQLASMIIIDFVPVSDEPKGFDLPE